MSVMERYKGLGVVQLGRSRAKTKKLNALISPLAAASQEKQLSQEEVEEVVRARPCCMQFETIIVQQENFGPWEGNVQFY